MERPATFSIPNESTQPTEATSTTKVRHQPRRFSIDEYHRMGETGILTPKERVELIDGVIYQMSPVNPPHGGANKRLLRLFERLNGEPARWVTQVQDPVVMPDRSEPVPDVALLRPREDFYSSAHPRPADVLLLIAIADSSVGQDRGQAVDYARAGIQEYWIVNLRAARVEVYRQLDPAARSYAPPTHAVFGAVLSPAAFPDVSVAVADLLGAAGRLAAPVPGDEVQARLRGVVDAGDGGKA